MVQPVSAPAPAVMVESAMAELPAALWRPTLAVPATTAASNSGGTGQQPNQPGAGSPGLEKMLEQLNQSMQAWATGLRFDLDKDAQRLVVSIVEHDSGKVLRTIPSDAVLRVAKMITQLQGASVDTRA